MYRDETGGGGGGRRFLMPMVSARSMIRMQNQPAMEDFAWKRAYGRSVPRRYRRVVMMMASLQAVRKKHPTAGTVVEFVTDANDVTDPTARKHIEWAIKWGLVSREQDGTCVYYFFDLNQLEKLRLIQDLLDAIADVVDAQQADPTNPRAGAELVPEDVYVNIIEREQIRSKEQKGE